MSASRCRFCDHPNPDAARYCNACGSPLHLKPCPQCEAVNDTAAEQCYECGAALETGAVSNAVSAAETSIPAAAAENREQARPVPEAFGARLDELPQAATHGDINAAQRRDEFVRSSRRLGAMFFAVLVLVVAVLGYYGYEYRSRQDSGVGPVAASGHDDSQPATAAERDAVVGPTNAAAPESPAATEPVDNADQPSAATQPAATQPAATQPAATQPAATQTTTAAASADATAPNDVRQSNDVKAPARHRTSAAQSAGKPGPEQYSRPAAASNAAAQATQRTIERYLGGRAGASSQPQRSVQ